MIAKGGKSLLEMRHLDKDSGFVSAGIVDVTDAQGIPDEEWFGPLLQIFRADDFDSAMKIANATEFGLAAALISNDEALWKTFQARARAGIVKWNRRPPARPAARRSAASANRATIVRAPTMRPTIAPIRSPRSKTAHSKCRRSFRLA